MFRMRYLLLISALLALPSCELFTEISEPPTRAGLNIERLVIQPADPALKVGGVLQLTALAYDADEQVVSNPNISWLSETPGVAIVDSSGKLAGVSVGQATITATSGEVRASITVSVTPDHEAAVTQVTLTPEQLTLNLQESRALTVEVFSAEGKIEAPTITWTTSNPDVASVTNNGVVRGLVVGEATITAKSGAKQDTTRVIVQDAASTATISVAAGRAHACALDGRGQAYCWGQGRAQQWGVPFNESGLLKIHQVNTTARFKRLVAGDSHTCGLTNTGEVYCWGRGELGQLGDGMSLTRATPVKISSTLAFTALSSFADTTCALAQDKKLYCWGDNVAGQLGLDPMTTTASNTPVQVASAYDFEQVSVGDAHVCALSGAEIYCWGDNSVGQLALPQDTAASREPRLVRGANNTRQDFKYVAVGESVSCGVTINGQTLCWGFGQFSRLGQEGEGSSFAPLLIPGGHSFDQLYVGQRHICGIKLDGQVWCWGNNHFGGFARKPLTQQNLPTRIGGNLLFEQVSLHDTFACGISRGDGELYCWGDRGEHYLGDGRFGFLEQPVKMLDDGEAQVSAVSVGWRHTCVRRLRQGMAQGYCWGRGTEGQLGIEQENEVLASAGNAVDTSEDGVIVAAGREHTCAMDNMGVVRCWGKNTYGQLGTGNRFDSVAPKAVNFASPNLRFSALVAGDDHTCVITAPDGHLYCWGLNDQGQVGDGATNPQGTARPTRVSDLEGVKAVSLGRDHTCAILSDDAVQCWGSNDLGQLGVGDAMPSSTLPVTVANLSGARSVSAGEHYSCAVELNGGVKCWGLNSYNRLGVTGAIVNTPTRVELMPSMRQVSAGVSNTCAISAGGEVYCWGYGLLGGLGQLSTVESAAPQKLDTLSNIEALDVGHDVACAISADQALYCWGRTLQGQLEQTEIGVNTTPTKLTLGQ